DEALAALRKVPALRLDFSALCESCSPDKSRIHHPWFTTVAGAYVRAIARMLVHPDGESIRLFPGLPAGTWQELEFRLMAHGNIEVHVKLEAGVIRTLGLRRRAPGTRRCRMTIPKGYLAAGQTVAGVTGREVDGKIESEVNVDERGAVCI
ncbi:MAG: hypothetical protein NTU94_10595, partial [Planctomycetota bacterium]|nr:hypothetical protein [Planctomycetota bacterium]